MSEARMTIEEAVRHLGVSLRTVRGYTASGMLRVVGTGPKGRKFLDPVEVEELRKDRAQLRHRTAGEMRAELIELRACARRLRAEMDLVLQMLDMRDAPQGLTREEAEALYYGANEQLRRTSWDLSELAKWAEVFMHLQEEDFRVVAGVAEGPPWTPFLRLCVSMIVYTHQHEGYKTSLDLQMLHRRLTEGRRRLRVSALCYSDLYEVREGVEQRELRRAALLDSPASVRESLLSRARAKRGATTT